MKSKPDKRIMKLGSDGQLII